MNGDSILQVISTVSNTLAVLMFAVGYYLLIKLYRKWLHESKEARTAGGRHIVVVIVNYTHLSEVSVVVGNFTEASVNDITFDFSTLLENSNGVVLSGLPYVEQGLPFLAPKEEISRYWDRLPTLAPTLKKKGLEEDIKVTQVQGSCWGVLRDQAGTQPAARRGQWDRELQGHHLPREYGREYLRGRRRAERSPRSTSGNEGQGAAGTPPREEESYLTTSGQLPSPPPRTPALVPSSGPGVAQRYPIGEAGSLFKGSASPERRRCHRRSTKANPAAAVVSGRSAK